MVRLVLNAPRLVLTLPAVTNWLVVPLNEPVYCISPKLGSDGEVIFASAGINKVASR